jgi:excisionase family DNA binding protein
MADERDTKRDRHEVFDVTGGRLLKVNEVAEFLGEHAKTVYRWLQLGRLDSIVLGRQRRVSPKALLRLIRQDDESNDER